MTLAEARIGGAHASPDLLDTTDGSTVKLRDATDGASANPVRWRRYELLLRERATPGVNGHA